MNKNEVAVAVNNLWEIIKPIINKSGVTRKTLPTEYMGYNELRRVLKFLKEFESVSLKEYYRIRGQGTHWENMAALYPGEKFPEIEQLKKELKEVRREWERNYTACFSSNSCKVAEN